MMHKGEGEMSESVRVPKQPIEVIRERWQGSSLFV